MVPGSLNALFKPATWHHLSKYLKTSSFPIFSALLEIDVLIHLAIRVNFNYHRFMSETVPRHQFSIKLQLEPPQAGGGLKRFIEYLDPP